MFVYCFISILEIFMATIESDNRREIARLPTRPVNLPEESISFQIYQFSSFLDLT